MRNKILILSALMLMSAVGAFAEIVTGYVYVNGDKVSAEYTKLSETTLALGSGQNTCISQYCEGRLIVPGKVTIDGSDYTVTEISNMAFRLCTKLTFVEIKENINRIGDFAFVGCKGVKEVALPASLKSIGTGAFIDLPLENVYCNGNTPATWEYNDVFKFHKNGITDEEPLFIGASTRLVVSENAVDNYKDALYSNEALGWVTPEGWGHFSTFNDEYLKNWRIYQPEDLETLREYLAENEKYEVKKVTFEADIDMSERPEWTYGLCRYANKPFTGTVDGQGHKIIGLQVINPDQAYLGLFDYFQGDAIRNLTLQDCEFSGKFIVGSLIGIANGGAKTIVIEDVFSESKVKGGQLVGGLVGSAFNNVELDLNRCVFDGNVIYDLGIGDRPNETYCGVGGLVGGARWGSIKNCAVWGGPDPDNSVPSGPFLGTTRYGSISNGTPFTIDKCYQDNTDYKVFDNYNPSSNDDKINMTNVVIAYRDKYDLIKENGIQNNVYQHKDMKGFVMASVLGTDDWSYRYGDYPLPYSFESRWEEYVNAFIIRPQGLKPRANGLSPVETFPPEAWRSELTSGDNRDFHFREFTTSSLWIDDDIEPDHIDRPDVLPLGMAKITAKDGVLYERELKAIYTGNVPISLPVYEMDENGNFIEDENGNPIETGEKVMYEVEEFTPVGYSVYLPYDLTLSPFSKLYQPYKVTREDGATTVTFKEVKNNLIEAFKPYYIVVEKESEHLGTFTEEICPQYDANTSIDLGDFEFVGTNSKIVNIGNFNENAYILQSDGKWHKMPLNNPKVYIPALRAYFRSKGNNSANTLSMALANDTTTDVVKIQTIDADGTEHYYDLSGRRLPDKPAKGAYIYKGKKFLNK